MSSSPSPRADLAGAPNVDHDRPYAFLVPFAVASVAVHAALFWYLAVQPPPPVKEKPRPVELVMVEVEPPPPPEPPKEEPPPPPPKKVVTPAPPKPVAPPPLEVAEVKPPPEPPKEELPPPPNDAPPPEPAKKPVLIAGISMSSTTTAGTFSAAVGNTAYGKTADTATDPNAVKGYSAPKYAPIHTVDSAPVRLSEVKPPYPPEARRMGIEGQVVLMLTIDETGEVKGVRFVSGPGYGLNEAAVKAAWKFRFKPASKGGAAVATELRYVYSFYLD